MTEREKREKVIKGLGSCVEYFACKVKGVMFDEWIEESRKAIALLKAQEPRVMTLEEAQGEDEVWFEFRPSNVGRYADCYMHDTGDRTRVYFTGKSVMSLFENADYGRQWRCWTSRPTEEQRKAIPWN